MLDIDLTLKTAQIILEVLAGLGILIAGFGFAYAQFKSGANKAKDDLVNTLQDALKVEKDKNAELMASNTELVASHQTQLTDLTQQVGKLQGLYEQSEKQKNEYLLILQGRDKESLAYKKAVLEVMVIAKKFIEDKGPKIDRINRQFNRKQKGVS